MKKLIQKILIAIFVINVNYLNAQLTTLPSGGNKKASVSELVGLTNVTIHYDRPAVKGREGKIWGQLVHYGFQNLGFGTSKAAPWRAGANENTTIEFSTPVKVEGKDLAAGKYGLFMAMSQGEATIIFSKQNSAWGSYFYDSADDILRVSVKTMPTTEGVERLKYEFLDQTESGATIALLWEKLKIPFKIETDLVKNQLDIFRKELVGEKGEDWKAWELAANYCAERNINLNEALTWADYSISGTFIGEKNFKTLSTKAQILTLLNKPQEANDLMKEALPLGNMNDLHQYGRSLLRQKKAKEAFEVFKLNNEKYPTEYMTLMGMTRGYSAIGEYKKAIEYAEKALSKAPDNNNKSSIAEMLVKLKEGKDIN